MSYLSQNQPWLSEEDIHYNLSMARVIRQRLQVIIDQRTWQTARFVTPDWLERLLRAWHSHRATVVTLNYDTLVERASRV